MTNQPPDPPITFPPELPVSQRRGDIEKAIADHQVVIVAGETGSGKTTQLPKILLAMGRGQKARIGHTQPRRIAARSVAERIAEELGTELGDRVGYQVRFTDRTSRDTRIKVMTDGILLAELQHDRELRRYDTIIIDEAHERSLNIDFLLGYLKQLLPRRPDLKLVITSATIDPERFSRHFGDAPIIEVSGRTYPVEIRYRPLVEDNELDEDGEQIVRDQTEAILAAVQELCGEGPGDILVFLPGEREIRDTAEALKGPSQGVRGFDVVPLFSRLSAAEQHRVFQHHTRRRVVLATNVAETSLTVPGIRYVIDTGLARISRYSLRTKVQRLPIEEISQASANQRAGRCGRVEAGVCIRLYDEEDFLARPEFTDPEILRTNLASVILQMTSLGLGDVSRFGFVEPPDQRNVKAGVQLLEELGAISTGRRRGLTAIGRKLARLPVDPRLGRMILEADRRGCLREVLVITAALSGQDPRERPVEQQQRADEFHRRFVDPTSDFMAWLNLWGYIREQQGERGSSSFRRMCREEHLNYLRIREWQELERQLRQLAKEIGLSPGRAADKPDADGIHQSLLSGLLSHIGMKVELDDRRSNPQRRRPMAEFLGARNASFAIFPGSGLARKPPDFVMAAELVETGRLWARQNATIDPVWAEKLGAHLVKRQYAEPHWSRKRAAVMARERVTLYGVPLVADRLVNMAKLDPVLSRELFIRHALVEGDWHTRHRFMADNMATVERAQELEHRARRRDIVVDDETLVDFYDQRVPADVVSGAHFDQWWKQERRQRPDLLTFDLDMLVHEHAAGAGEGFPDHWQTGSHELPLRYHFEPGHQDDGVTVDIPVSTLNTMSEAGFSWHVPGMREELVIALIRGLPKHLRVNFVPVPDVAREFLRTAVPGEESLTEALSRHLRARTGVHVPQEAWRPDVVAAHLRPTFRVVDEQGSELSRGQDLAALKAPLARQLDAAVTELAAAEGNSASGQTTWTFGTIAETFTTVQAGHDVVGHPALIDEGETVGLRVFGDREVARAHHRLGVRRLLAVSLDDPTDAIVKGFDNSTKLGLAASPYPSVKALVRDLELGVLGDLVDGSPEVRDADSWWELHRQARDLAVRTRQYLPALVALLAKWREVDSALHGRVELAMLPVMTELRARLVALMHPGFLAEVGAQRVSDLTRYLTALQQRHAQLGNLGHDRLQADRIDHLQHSFDHRIAALPEGQPPTEALRQAGAMLEEFRVSLWAQHLGTHGKVSEQRIQKLLDQR